MNKQELKNKIRDLVEEHKYIDKLLIPLEDRIGEILGKLYPNKCHNKEEQFNWAVEFFNTNETVDKLLARLDNYEKIEIDLKFDKSLNETWPKESLPNEYINKIIDGIKLADAASKIVDLLEEKGFVSENNNSDITPEIMFIIQNSLKKNK